LRASCGQSNYKNLKLLSNQPPKAHFDEIERHVPHQHLRGSGKEVKRTVIPNICGVPKAEEIDLSITESKERPQTGRHWLALGCSLALTIGTLYFVFRRIDKNILERLLEVQDRRLLIVAVLLIVLQIGFAGERWRTILSALTRGPQPPALSVQAVYYASIFFNCLPIGTIGGDVARVWLARRLGLSVNQLVLSVLLDRVLTVGALLVLAVLTLPGVPHPLALSAWFGCVIILLCAATGYGLLRPVARLLGRWRDLRFIHLILRTAEELRHVTRRRGLLALFYAVMSALCSALGAYCIARSLGIDLGPIPIIAIMSIVIFVAALPISFAGWGVREVSLVTILGLLGINRDAALLMSVEFGLLGTFLSLPGGIIWLTMRQKRAS